MKHRSSTAAAIAVLLLSFLQRPAVAQDFGTLYDDQVLEHWQDRYAEGILWNLRNVLVPNLTVDEQRHLTELAIEFPLRGASGHPFEYYAIPPARVVMPVLSLKFFDDISVAYAWLSRNGYSPETVLEYVAMLKYRATADLGGDATQPLEALQIPADALDDPAVDDLAQKIFKSAVVFIVLHEMGHVRHGHPGYGPDVRRADTRDNEAEADRFALEVMRRLPAQPTGMFLFFQALAYAAPNRGDYDTDAAYEAALADETHPLTPQRMAAIASLLRSRADDFALEYADRPAGRDAVVFVADQIDLVAEIMTDPDIQRLIAETGRRTTLAGLAPRRPGETVGMARDAASAGGAGETAVPFAGTFDGEITVDGTAFSIRTVLRRGGDRVTGLYSYGIGQGTIDGIVDGDELRFEWIEGDLRGRGVLRPGEAGTFRGTWGYGTSHDDGGGWIGRAVKG